MNSSAQPARLLPDLPNTTETARAAADPASDKRHWELLVCMLLLVVLNLPLLSGHMNLAGIFLPEAVQAGQWWRLLTHPFVHVSWYHLLLDGVAFLMLYHGLAENRLRWRLAYLTAAGAGSLVAAWLAAPGIATLGLCGLSGVAHGLMAVVALEMLTAARGQPLPGQPAISPEIAPGLFWTGLLGFAVVVLKSGLEACLGRALLTGLHFQLLGVPIAVCHAGGVLGGLAAFTLRHARTQPNKRSQTLLHM